MSQTHIRAVNRTINALRLDKDDRYSALVETARTLARQMDKAGAEPSTRLVAACLSSLKDLNRATPTVETRTSSSPTDELEEYLKQFA